MLADPGRGVQVRRSESCLEAMKAETIKARDAKAFRAAVKNEDWEGAATQLAEVSAIDAAANVLEIDEPARSRVLRALAECECPAGNPREAFLVMPYRQVVGRRLGWLVVLMIGQMFTATVLDYFDEQLERALVLALFIPMIISSGGNAGSQASTLLIRAMAMGEVRLLDWWRVVGRELVVGAILGLVLGCVAFARIAVINRGYGDYWWGIAWTIGLSTVAVVLCGSLLGSILPLLLRACRTDPATSSAPFVATLADVGGLIIYFSIAIAILKGTIL